MRLFKARVDDTASVQCFSTLWSKLATANSIPLDERHDARWLSSTQNFTVGQHDLLMLDALNQNYVNKDF